MGCGGDSGRGSSVARFHDNRIKTRGCTAAFRDRLISKGHTLQFTSVPPRFNGIVETTLSSKDQQLSLLAEPQRLLAKNLISTVPKGEEMQGFYSRYFLVPKKTGGLRPILDLALVAAALSESHIATPLSSKTHLHSRLPPSSTPIHLLLQWK